MSYFISGNSLSFYFFRPAKKSSMTSIKISFFVSFMPRHCLSAPSIRCDVYHEQKAKETFIASASSGPCFFFSSIQIHENRKKKKISYKIPFDVGEKEKSSCRPSTGTSPCVLIIMPLQLLRGGGVGPHVPELGGREKGYTII